jgi:2-polyprenyl-6-methoxyphenol hydroxylase-like FAD-dependent oxidoreductase
MRAEATDLVIEEGAVRGLRYRGPEGDGEVRATLTVAADGRSSVLRDRAGLALRRTSPPIDVLWFRLPRVAGDDDDTGGYVGNGHIVALINRNDYWQIAYVIPKGSAERLRRAGIDELRRTLRELVPGLADRTDLLTGWDHVSLLSVQADRLRRWYRPGLLCIGDAAHAMSPVGGLGINFAIQDAVEAANVLAEPLRRGQVTTRHLATVQRRRAWQVRIMQFLQAQALRAALVASGPETHGPGLVLRRIGGRLVNLPARTRLASRLIALGIRRVHVAGG